MSITKVSIRSFVSERFGSIRIVMKGDEPWFVARDAAKALGYSNTKDVILSHCKKAETLENIRGRVSRPPVNSGFLDLDPYTEKKPVRYGRKKHSR